MAKGIVDVHEVLFSISEKANALTKSNNEEIITELDNLAYIVSYLNDLCFEHNIEI